MGSLSSRQQSRLWRSGEPLNPKQKPRLLPGWIWSLYIRRLMRVGRVAVSVRAARPQRDSFGPVPCGARDPKLGSSCHHATGLDRAVGLRSAQGAVCRLALDGCGAAIRSTQER